MKPVIALLIALATVSAQNPAPSPDGALQPPPKPNEEMLKWLETVDSQWQATFAQEVTAPFDAEKVKLAQQYAAGLEANLAKASAAGNLDATLLWRNERDRFASEKDVPAEDDATAPAELKQLRAAWRTQLVRLEKDRAVRAKSVHARYDQVLAQAQTQLTQKHRIEDALLVKNKREEVAARWMAQQPSPTMHTSIAKTPAAPVANPAKPPFEPTMETHPRIGEAFSDMTKRFGVWRKQEGSRLPGTERYLYKSEGFQAEAIVSKDKVVMVVLHRDLQRISDDNLKTVMKANGDGHRWTLNKKSGEWIRSDRAIRIFVQPGHPDFLFMQDIAAVEEILEKDRPK